MDMRDILAQGSVVVDLKATSKKQVLQVLADKADAMTKLGARDIFDTILQREKLGSTGVGAGVAIPHGKFNKATAITGLVARLEKPVDFDAIDDEPVDIVFLLIAPESAGADHLKALARVARVFRDKSRLHQLRNAADADEVYRLLIEDISADAA